MAFVAEANRSAISAVPRWKAGRFSNHTVCSANLVYIILAYVSNFNVYRWLSRIPFLAISGSADSLRTTGRQEGLPWFELTSSVSGSITGDELPAKLESHT